MSEKNNRVSQYGVEEMFLNRWSSRSFSPKKIDQEQIDQLFEAAHWAPSSNNRQPWRFVYATDGSLTTNRDFEEAKKYVLKGLELNPYQQRYYPPILCCVGLLEYEDAINFCNKSIEVDPNFTGAYGWKASMLAHLGRMDEAKEILQIYMDLRPEIKSLSDYEKVAPTVIKEVLIDGLRKAGLTE